LFIEVDPLSPGFVDKGRLDFPNNDPSIGKGLFRSVDDGQIPQPDYDSLSCFSIAALE